MSDYISKYILFPEKDSIAVPSETVTSDRLPAHEIILQAEASVISAGTELARLSGTEYRSSFPARPGYGMIGKIIEKGSEIAFPVGTRIFCAGSHASYQRFQCNQDHQWNYAFPVPDGLDPVEASIACMAEIAMTAPNLSDVRLGDTVAVFGLGMVGLLSALMYQLKGANVIGIDPAAFRCELAKKMGIRDVIDCPPDRQYDSVMALTGGKGAHITVDAAGHSAVLLSAIKVTAEFGEILSLGSPRTPYPYDLTEVFKEIHLKCCRLTGAHMWQYPVQAQRGVKKSVAWAFNTCFDLIRTKKLDVTPLISHIIPAGNLENEITGVYDGLRNKPNEYTCAVIDWRK